MRSVIAVFKVTMLALICVITLPFIALSWLLFKNSKLSYIVPFCFHRSLCLVFGLKVRTQGIIETNKQCVFVGNHLSYLDIPVLGGILKARFVSKDDVKHWPMLGVLARFARTIFISRTPSDALKSIAQMKESIDGGDNLIVFPEGTSSRGDTVQTFKSSFFDIFLKNDHKDTLKIQPFSVALIKVDKRALQSASDYDSYAWYGDMDLKPHIWQLALSRGFDIIVRFHEPIELKKYENRKILSKDCYDSVENGLTDLQSDFLPNLFPTIYKKQVD